MMPLPNPRVVKLGGSLFALDDLSSRLTHWLSGDIRQPTLLIAGGGDLVDVMRDLDDRFEFDQVELHWRCVRLLRFTFELCLELLPQASAIETNQQLSLWRQECKADSVGVVAIDHFYTSQSSLGATLPTNWETTTDSIAAAFAIHTHVDELVLLKSCNIPEGIGWKSAAEQGFVDQAFPSVARQLKSIRSVNLSTGTADPTTKTQRRR